MTRYRYSDDDLHRLVAESSSVTEVMRKLGMKITGGSHYHLSGRIRKLGLDTSHFNGQGWSRGVAFPERRRSLSEVFVILPPGSNRPKGYLLRRSLLESGVEYRCQICGLTDWLNKPITLDVDHIDGDWLNNLKDNLRFLCPNCHSQTDNFGAKGMVL